jgi:hypothetical protein
VVIHPQSVIHSLVDYEDGSVLAQLGNPDMRTPIAHAMAWPERIDSGVAPLDLFAVGAARLRAPGPGALPLPDLAYRALRAEGNAAGGAECRQRGGGGRLPRTAPALSRHCRPDCRNPRRVPQAALPDLAAVLEAIARARAARKSSRGWGAAHESANAGLVCRRLPGGPGGAGGGARNGPLPAARACGVKVLRFAFGFGKVIWMRRHGRDGTEWAISAFPLGGYVKMLDEREGEVPAPNCRAPSTGRPSAGAPSSSRRGRPPTSCWPSCCTGSCSCMASPNSSRASVCRRSERRRRWPASAKAVTVRAVNGKAIETWQQLRWEVMRQALDKEVLQLEVISPQREIGVYRIASDRFDLEELEKIPCALLGLVLYRPRAARRGGTVQSGSAAEAGFREATGCFRSTARRLPCGRKLAAWRAGGGWTAVCAFEIERDGGRLELAATRGCRRRAGKSWDDWA